MKRVIFIAPKNTKYTYFTSEQQQAIRSVFGQYVIPVPNTRAVDNKILIDATTTDNFNPDNMRALGFDWELVGMWQMDNTGVQIEIIAPNITAISERQIPIPDTYDEYGGVTSTRLAKLSEFHNWAGWEKIGE